MASLLLYKDIASARLSPTNTITSNIQYSLIFIIHFILIPYTYGKYTTDKQTKTSDTLLAIPRGQKKFFF